MSSNSSPRAVAPTRWRPTSASRATRWWSFITWVEIPAGVVLAIWFVIQLFSGVGELGADVGGGVGYWAHVGGFAFGALVAWLSYRRPRAPGPTAYGVEQGPSDRLGP